MNITSRIAALAGAVALASVFAAPAAAVSVHYAIDIQVLYTTGSTVDAGDIILDAGGFDVESTEVSASGVSVASIGGFDFAVAGQSWTLGDATDPATARFVDGNLSGISYTGINGTPALLTIAENGWITFKFWEASLGLVEYRGVGVTNGGGGPGSAMPEPGAALLFAVGFAAVGAGQRRGK